MASLLGLKFPQITTTCDNWHDFVMLRPLQLDVLERLVLRKRKVEDFKVLMVRVRDCERLVVLDLHENEINAEIWFELVEVLKQCKALTTLDISDNPLRTDGCTGLNELLSSYFRFKDINLSNLKMGTEGCREFAANIGLSVELEALNINGNNIGLAGITQLIEGLKHCPHLQSLCLSKNEIGPEGTKLLASALVCFPALSYLDLSNNFLGSSGCEALSSSIKHCPNIHTLNLSGNEINAVGCSYVRVILSSLPLLESLNLSWNEMGPEGSLLIRDGLLACTHLKILEIDGNRLFKDGLAHIVAGLSSCQQSLQSLSFVQNRLNMDALEILINFAKANENVMAIFVGGSQSINLVLQNRIMSLNLSGTMLNDIGGMDTLLALVTLRLEMLSDLNLKDCQINGVDLLRLSEALIRHWGCPYQINLIGNKITSAVMRVLSSYLLSEEGGKRTITSILLGREQQQSFDLARVRTLSSLDFTGILDYMGGIESLSCLVPYLKNGCRLLLNVNRLSVNDVQTILSWINPQKNLKIFIGAVASFHIASGWLDVANPATSTCIDIIDPVELFPYFGNIEGFNLILPRLLNLRRLKLRDVPISTDAGIELISALTKCSSLEAVELPWFNLGLAGLESLLLLRTYCPKLTSIIITPYKGVEPHPLIFSNAFDLLAPNNTKFVFLGHKLDYICGGGIGVNVFLPLFRHLRSLTLRGCGLNVFPESIRGLTELRILDLSLNDLLIIPSWIIELGIEDLRLNNNTELYSPPYTLLENIQSTQTMTVLRTYFLQLARVGGGPLKVLNFVVLGEPMAGKTSLLRSLMNGQQSLTSIEERTKLLDCIPKKFSGGMAFWWDFGGQDEYRVTQTLFLGGNRSVYILVIPLDAPPDVSSIISWIRFMASRSASSTRLIVLASKIDLCPSSLITSRVEEIFSVISSLKRKGKKTILTRLSRVLLQSSEERTPTSQILSALVLPQKASEIVLGNTESSQNIISVEENIIRASNFQEMSCFRDIVPNSWLRLLEIIETYKSNPSISCIMPVPTLWDRVSRDCKFEKLDEFRVALGFIHNLGHLLYFSNAPTLRDIVFLRPLWVANILKTIFRHDLHVLNQVTLSSSLYLHGSIQFAQDLGDLRQAGLLHHRIVPVLFWVRMRELTNEIATFQPSCLPESGLDG